MEMQNFIVLGWIPGTHIQITFQLWMLVIEYLLGIVLAYKLIRRRDAFNRLLVTLYIRYILTRRKVSITL